MKVRMADEEIAAELRSWFGDVVRLWSSVCFDWSSSPQHREAAMLEILSRNAKLLLPVALDSRGNLYRPLTLILAAICRQLDVIPTQRHWLAALRNVEEMRRRINVADSERLALAVGTPASILKELFCEALINAGVTDRPTLLVEENRRVSLGLALNWGLRLLIAYALEMSPLARPRTSQVHDLRWLRSLLVR
jgi:hypothetical protein